MRPASLVPVWMLLAPLAGCTVASADPQGTVYVPGANANAQVGTPVMAQPDPSYGAGGGVQVGQPVGDYQAGGGVQVGQPVGQPGWGQQPGSGVQVGQPVGQPGWGQQPQQPGWGQQPQQPVGGVQVGQPVGQPGWNGQPVTAQPTGQPGWGAQPAQGQPAGQPGVARPVISMVPGQNGVPTGQPAMGQPAMGQPAPMGQPAGAGARPVAMGPSTAYGPTAVPVTTPAVASPTRGWNGAIQQAQPQAGPSLAGVPMGVQPSAGLPAGQSINGVPGAAPGQLGRHIPGRNAVVGRPTGQGPIIVPQPGLIRVPPDPSQIAQPPAPPR